MSIRLVALVCLSFWAGFLSCAAGAEPANKELNLSGQWDLTIKYGRQELHGFFLLRQDGNEIKGEGRDHADFKLTGLLDKGKKPPRALWTREYLDKQAGDSATFSGDVRFESDLPSISGKYDVQPTQPGRQAIKKAAMHGVWEARMLERLTPGDYPTYMTPGDYIIQGESYVKLGDYRNAVTNFTKAISLNPKDALAYISRGAAYNRLGQPEKALDDFTRAIDLDPEDGSAYLNRGLARRKLGQSQQAISDLSAAINLNPKDSLAYSQRGFSEFQLRQYQKAVDDYGKALDLNASDAQAYYYRGLSYSKLGQHQAAVEDLGHAIKLNAQDANAYRERGRAYSELGEYDKAIDDYTAAITLNPRDRRAYAGRGLAYSHRAIAQVKQGREHTALADDAKAFQDYAQAIPENIQVLVPAMLAGAGSVVVILIVALLVRRGLLSQRTGKNQTPTQSTDSASAIEDKDH